MDNQLNKINTKTLRSELDAVKEQIRNRLAKEAEINLPKLKFSQKLKQLSESVKNKNQTPFRPSRAETADILLESLTACMGVINDKLNKLIGKDEESLNLLELDSKLNSLSLHLSDIPTQKQLEEAITDRLAYIPRNTEIQEKVAQQVLEHDPPKSWDNVTFYY